MKIHRFFLLTAVVFASTNCLSQEPESESSCFPLDRECLAKERIKKRRELLEKRDAEIMAALRRDSEKREAERKANEEETQRLRELKYQQMKEEQARAKAESDAEERAAEKRDRAAQKQRESQISEQKSRCGADYKTPAIGMTLERLKDCVAPVKLSGQVNRADGIASVYTYGPLWVNVMSGKIVAWGK